MPELLLEACDALVGVPEAQPGHLDDGVKERLGKRNLLTSVVLRRVGVDLLDEVGRDDGGEHVERVPPVVPVLDLQESEREEEKAGESNGFSTGMEMSKGEEKLCIWVGG